MYPKDVERDARRAAKVAGLKGEKAKGFFTGYCDGYAAACEGRTASATLDIGSEYGQGFKAGWHKIADLFNGR